MGNRLSVIITNYNYLRYLPSAVESVRNQEPDELIVVDDGSTDGSVEWLRSTRGITKLICKANGGQASAMNAGYRVSTGDLIWFLDADDILISGALAAVRQVWRPGLSKVHIRCQVIDGIGRYLRLLPQKWCELPSGDLAGVYGYLGFYPSVPTSGNVYSRDFLDKVGPIPEVPYRICADAYLHDWAPLKGEIESVSTPVVGYRIHGTNNFALREISRNEEWFRQKAVRLSTKWLVVRSLAKIPHWVVRGLFMLSPDYLDTTKKISAFQKNERDRIEITVPTPSYILDLALSFLRISFIYPIYCRFWLAFTWTVYKITRS